MNRFISFLLVFACSLGLALAQVNTRELEQIRVSHNEFSVPAERVGYDAQKRLPFMIFEDKDYGIGGWTKKGSPVPTIQTVPSVKYSTFTGVWGFYDYQSNDRSPRYLYITPDSTFQNMHVTMMTATDSTDTTSINATRHVGYGVSSDGGRTWSSVNDLSVLSGERRLGFPSVSDMPAFLDPNGKRTPVVVAHAGNTSGAVYTTTYFADTLSSTDFSSAIDAKTVADRSSGTPPIWPCAVPNKDGNLFITGTSSLTPASLGDSPIQTAILDVNGLGTYTKWANLQDSLLTYNSGGRDAVAVSPAGKIGVAWPHPATAGANYGIYLAESTDGGKTFSTPVLVVDQIINSTNMLFPATAPDSLFVDGNVDLQYVGETPHIVFTASWDGLYLGESLWHWTPSTGAKQFFLTDVINGIGSQSQSVGLTATTSVNLAQPNMSTISYPTLGIGTDPSKMMCVFQATSEYVDHSRGDSTFILVDNSNPSTPFYWYNLWACVSPDTGHHWTKPFIVNGISTLATGDAFERVNCDYPHLAELNPTVNDTTTFSLVFQARRHPGMYAFRASTTAGAIPSGPINATYLMLERIALASEDFAVGVNENSLSQFPGKSALYQNFPNPFSQSSTITYDLNATQHVKIIVCNMLGREMSTLVDGTEYIGRHTSALRTDGFPAGMYTYVLETGNDRISRSFVVTK